MNQPIYTVIKDNCNVARSLTWLAKGAKWLPAGGTVVLDYDPWSCASAAQRVSIEAAASRGAITMTINALGPDGKYGEIQYCPGAAVTEPFVAATVQPALAAPAPVFRASAAPRVDTATHTVVAGENKVASKFGIKSTVVEAPAAGSRNGYGFSTSDDVAPVNAAAGLDKKAVVAAEKEAEPPAQVQPPQVPPPADVAQAAAAPEDDDDKARYNALVADKKWAEAYRLLKARFGEDRITFSQRSLQYSGDWDALVAKYGLE